METCCHNPLAFNFDESRLDKNHPSIKAFSDEQPIDFELNNYKEHYDDVKSRHSTVRYPRIQQVLY